MKSSKNILVLSITPWDFARGNNAKDLALEMSKNHQVIYVNPPLDRITLWKERHLPEVQSRWEVINHRKSPLEKVHDHLHVFTPDVIIESINWLPHGPLFHWLNKQNNQIFAHSIRKALDALEIEEFYIFNDSDMLRSFHLKEFLRPEKYIYYTRDNLMAVPYWKRHGQFYEPALAQKSDVVVANSAYLADVMKAHNPRSYDVGQGCDLEAFLQKNTNKHPKPKDLATIPGPIIGYAGALFSLRLDLGLIEHLAKKHPHASIVLVGPEDSAFEKSSLHSLPNVHFLGNKPPHQLVDYMRHFEVCINPQLLNEVTIGNYPRKVDEYLALGKPVVATKTLTMESFLPHVYLATDQQEFAALIQKAMDENSPQKAFDRKNLAAQHSWKTNVNRIWEALEK